MVSTLALRWQSICPPGSIRSDFRVVIFSFIVPSDLRHFSGGQGGTSNAESPKDDEVSNTEAEAKDTQKLPFCEIQWQKVTEFVKTRKIKTPEEKTKVRWSYSPEEGPKCTTETFLSKKKDKKMSPVQVWEQEVLI